MKYADLHLHTIFSDGSYTPEKLVEECVKKGFAAIALSDHDTVDGVSRALSAAADSGIELIPALELTAEEEGNEVHILGYFIDHQNKTLLNRLKEIRENRVSRVYKICEKLKGLGLELQADEVFGMARKGSTVGRLHVAHAMLKKGLIRNLGEAFQRYIGDRGPGYVAGFRLNPQEAIQLIKSSSGIPIIAHPYSVATDDLIYKLIDYGAMGLEVYYPEHSQSTINFYLKIVQERGLIATGGSDFHGDTKPDVKLGVIKLPYEIVERLKEAKESL